MHLLFSKKKLKMNLNLKESDTLCLRISNIFTALFELDVQQRYYLSSTPKVLGRGAYGMVVEAVDQHTGQQVAIKHIRGESIARNTEEAKRILRELRINMLIRDEPNHILKLVDTMGVSRDGSVLMVYEMGLCDLYKISKVCPSSSSYPFDMIGLVFDVASALSIVHSRGVIHRDLKLSNLILMKNHRVALADFGISGPNVASDSSAVVMTSYVQSRGQRAPELLYRRLDGELRRFTETKDASLCKKFANVKTYFARRLGPEFEKIAQTPYGESIDIWSFGCVLAELVLQRPPFDEMHNFSVLGKIVWLRCNTEHECRLRDQLISSLSNESQHDREALVDLILWMLSIDPTERPSAHQIIDYMDRKWPEKTTFNRQHPSMGHNDVVVRPNISHHISPSSLPRTVQELINAMAYECGFFYFNGMSPLVVSHPHR
jgi:serine/threonine protein kinase